jgi:hypothetical protein
MKFRFIKEPKPAGDFLYSTEQQLPSGTWVYVSGTASRDLAAATALFERALVEGVPTMTVLREVTVRTPEELAAFIAEEDRINGDAA